MEDLPIDLAIVAEGPLANLLRGHPRIRAVGARAEAEGIEFIRGERSRHVYQGRADIELKGLVELMDNNPLVCADEFSVPDPASTLALIALGPLALAGLDIRGLSGTFNFDVDPNVLNTFMETVHLRPRVDIRDRGAETESESESYSCAQFIASIAERLTPKEIDELYTERYASSFFVDVHAGTRDRKPFFDSVAGASLRVDVVPPDVVLLVTSQTNGKCGAAQLIHAMNVMAGFEETLGIG